LKELIYKLREKQQLNRKEWIALIENRTPELAEELFRAYHMNETRIRRGLAFFD
jgi:hypothetical protein